MMKNAIIFNYNKNTNSIYNDVIETLNNKNYNIFQNLSYNEVIKTLYNYDEIIFIGNGDIYGFRGYDDSLVIDSSDYDLDKYTISNKVMFLWKNSDIFSRILDIKSACVSNIILSEEDCFENNINNVSDLNTSMKITKNIIIDTIDTFFTIKNSDNFYMDYYREISNIYNMKYFGINNIVDSNIKSFRINL